MRIGRRDRTFLAALGLFIAGMGCYLFVLDPLMTRLAKLRKVSSALRRTFLQQHAKAGELTHWRTHYDEAAQTAADLLGGVKRDLLSDSNTEIIRALLRAADAAGVQFRSLSPQTVVRVAADGTRTNVRQFSLQGKGDSGAFFRFLGELRGLNVEDLNVTLNAADNSVGFLMNVTVVPTAALQNIDLPAAKAAAAAALPADNPFSVRAVAGVTVAAGPAPAAKEVPQFAAPAGAGDGEDPLDLAGLRLVGVASCAGKKIAVIESAAEGTSLFLWEGDVLQGMTVSQVQDEAVVLAVGDRRSTLRLPAEKTLASDAADKGPTERGEAGRLGLRLATVTAPLKDATGYPAAGGLEVVLPRADSGAVLKGDIIAEINGQATPDLEVARHILDSLRADELLTLKLWRTGRWIATAIKALPAANLPAAAPQNKE